MEVVWWNATESTQIVFYLGEDQDPERSVIIGYGELALTVVESLPYYVVWPVAHPLHRVKSLHTLKENAIWLHGFYTALS